MPERKKTTSEALHELTHLLGSGTEAGSAIDVPKEKHIPEVEVPAPNIEELVSARAYDLWERSGQQPGRDLENWLQAEAEVRRNRSRQDS